MSKLISVRAYEYKELNDEAKATFIHYMYDSPFDYEDEDEEGKGDVETCRARFDFDHIEELKKEEA